MSYPKTMNVNSGIGLQSAQDNMKDQRVDWDLE